MHLHPARQSAAHWHRVQVWALLVGFALAWGLVVPRVTRALADTSALPAGAEVWLTNPWWQWAVVIVATPVLVLGRALLMSALTFFFALFAAAEIPFRHWWAGAVQGSFALLAGAWLETILVLWTGRLDVVLDFSLFWAWGRAVDPFELGMVAIMMAAVCRHHPGPGQRGLIVSGTLAWVVMAVIRLL